MDVQPVTSPKTKFIYSGKDNSLFQPEGKDLAAELNKLLLTSISARDSCGATHDIQLAYLRENEKKDASWPNGMPEYRVEQDADCGCPCKEDETCDLCDPDLTSICTADEVIEKCIDNSPYDKLSRLLSLNKANDFIALVEHAYASIGNKPFNLKSNSDIDITDDQIEKIAKDLNTLIENYITQNDVRTVDIPVAFNFENINDMIDALRKEAIDDTFKKNQVALGESEDVIERIFNRTNFMQEYIEVIKDTAEYPIGILWIDDAAVKKTKKIAGSRVKIEYKIQSSVERVSPAYCWFTPDHRLSNTGRAVFRLKRFSRGTIKRWAEMDVSGSDKLTKNINEFLNRYDEGGIIPQTLLFRNTHPLVDIDYDVIIARGRFTKEYVKSLDVKIPNIMQYDSYIPCEIYFSGNYVLRVNVMNVIDDRLGVYTTVFRRNGDSLFGYSVYDFTKPFADLYKNTVDAIDRGVGKSVGMIIQVDRGVIRDAEKYFVRDENGNIVLDISEDNIIEFDSTEAAFQSPNFKGFPVTITDIPSNLDKLIPMLSLVIQELERITNIPAMLTNGSNISSALRTTSNFNAAFAASNKIVQALLRESENRVLEPSIKYIFDMELLAGNFPSQLLELEPEILLSDTLTRDNNDKAEIYQHLSMLLPLAERIPAERFDAFINTFGREVLNLDEDLIPNVGVLRTQPPAEQTQGAV